MASACCPPSCLNLFRHVITCLQSTKTTSSAFDVDDDDTPAPSSLAAKLKAMAAKDEAKKAALKQSQAAMETEETPVVEEEEDDGVDPLDAFMQGVTAQVGKGRLADLSSSPYSSLSLPWTWLALACAHARACLR